MNKKTQILVRNYNSIKNEIIKIDDENTDLINEVMAYMSGFFLAITKYPEIREKHKETKTKLEKKFQKSISGMSDNEKYMIISFFENVNILNIRQEIKKQKNLFINSIASEFMIEESLIFQEVMEDESKINDYLNSFKYLMLDDEILAEHEVDEIIYESLRNKIETYSIIKEFIKDISVEDSDFE
jgi:hypothetical protein